MHQKNKKRRGGCCGAPPDELMKLHMAACVLCVQSGVNKGRSIDEGETLFRSSHREILDLYDTNTSSHFRVCFHKFKDPGTWGGTVATERNGCRQTPCLDPKIKASTEARCSRSS